MTEWKQLATAPKDKEFWLLCPDGSIQKSIWEFVETSDYDQMPIYDFWLPSRGEFFDCFWDGPYEQIEAYWTTLESIPTPPPPEAP